MDVAIVCVISFLMILVEHYWPWPAMIGRELPRPVAYVMGVLAIALPLSGLWIYRQDWADLAVLWGTIVSAGVATLGAYGLDHVLALKARVRAAERDGEILRGQHE